MKTSETQKSCLGTTGESEREKKREKYMAPRAGVSMQVLTWIQ